MTTTNTNSAITNAIMMAEAVKALKATNANPEIITKAEKHLEVLTKPRAKANGTTAKRKENEMLARKTFEILPDEPVSGKWIQERVAYITTSQKVVAVAKVATEMGLWEKVMDGKKVAYQKIQ